jgi:hypothetical protein
MTRIRFSDYRTAVRDRSFRVASGNPSQSFPTPASIQWATIKRHHQESPEVARTYMVSSFRNSSYWGSGGTAQSRGWADSTLRSYDTYSRLTANDARPVVATGVRQEIQLPPNSLSLQIDVILLDPRGYVPRTLLWDTNDLTEERAALYAAPILIAAEKELGEGRVVEIEVIHMRTGSLITVSAALARSALEEMTATVGRVLSEG